MKGSDEVKRIIALILTTAMLAAWVFAAPLIMTANAAPAADA